MRARPPSTRVSDEFRNRLLAKTLRERYADRLGKQPLLAERGIHLSREQAYRLVTQVPQRLSTDRLAALCGILDCQPNDLIEIEVVSKQVRKAAGESGQAAPPPVRRSGIDAHAGRNTARLALAAELPASVLADLTDISISTAERWSQWAKRDWAAYVGQRAVDDREGGGSWKPAKETY